jgi:hypothetical protein
MRWSVYLATVAAFWPAWWVLAQTGVSKGPPKPVKRAQPPAELPGDAFFHDAFKEALVGERPGNLAAGSASTAGSGVAASGTPTASSGSGGGRPGAGGNWSQWVSAATIEDTIKQLKQQIDRQITTPSDFAGKGHKLARRDFTLLAVLFAVAAEYDGDVRWKKEAAAARDAFGRSAANFKVGTTQAFNEARSRKDELAELIGGSSPFAGKEAEPAANWGQLAGRGPLMQFLEQVWEPRLKPALADKAKFTANAEQVLHDAELFALIGEVLAKEGMPDADASEYREFSHRLRDGARQVRDAVLQKNYEQASAASAVITKACAECHENYRS